MLIQGMPVRHRGDVIANNFILRFGVIDMISLINGIRQLLRILFVNFKKIFNDPLGLGRHPLNTVMMVKFFIQ